MPRVYTGPLTVNQVPEAMPCCEAYSYPGAAPAAATTVVKAEPAMLYSVAWNLAAVASTITIYDNASAASGTILYSGAKTGIAGGEQVGWTPSVPIYAKNGITVVCAGAGSSAIVYFT